ncbi:hypothetical protein [Dysgonomonas sp. Marseille-P4361]|uniref:hypothetical protein n=1 Tax=Dysgonomonas sp. Marseille-P4361 TaxID=2161820 RepID=UPI000D562EB8|nr:hypothetical protein [Dysgonomonas sp. Marseille-P4361]
MTEKDEKLLAEFEIRMRQLMYLCDKLREENALLKKNIQQKDTSINSLSSELEMLRTKYDNLKFVKSFSSEDKKDVDQAKLRLSKLVREVDKCIAMLKG